MATIFTAPRLRLPRDEDGWQHRYLDEAGQVMATVIQVVGESPPRGFARHFSSNRHNLSRIVLRADGPEGQLFFIDRAAADQPPTAQPPCAVVLPDGRVAGRIIHDSAAFGLSYLAGLRDPMVHGAAAGRTMVSYQEHYQLVDEHNRPLCAIVWDKVEVKRLPSGFDQAAASSGGQGCDYTDPTGVAVARYESDGDLRINHQLPWQLRTLVIASPIGMALMAAVFSG